MPASAKTATSEDTGIEAGAASEFSEVLSEHGEVVEPSNQRLATPPPAGPPFKMQEYQGLTFKQFDGPPPMMIDPSDSYTATIDTNVGVIVVDLLAASAPKTVNNFVFLAEDGFYDGLIFHRVIENFMIQGGDPTGTGVAGPGYKFEDETSPSDSFDRPGILAMANSGPNTNGSQFFITTVPTPHLNGNHTIFGAVVEGQDVADAISRVAKDQAGRPAQPVIIESIKISGEAPTATPPTTSFSPERDALAALYDAGPGDLTSVSAGLDHTCWVGTGGSVSCWGANRYGESMPPDGEFASVSAGASYSCGVRTDGSVTCWDDDSRGQATPPAGEFALVSAGNPGACGVRADSSVVCWGDDRLGQATLPAGEFASVSAGAGYACGVRTDGSVACWGDDRLGGAAMPAGAFASVSEGIDSLGGPYACGVGIHGSAACWGDDYAGETMPPEGRFTSVSAGSRHTCGVRTDDSVACWGWDDDGQATPPENEFASVSAGYIHTCGVGTDGSLTCWGDDHAGQATPPEGKFAVVSTGDFHTCGVRIYGSLACWGHNADDVATPPEGEFASVSTGDWHTCGVRPDGSVACWGTQARGITVP